MAFGDTAATTKNRGMRPPPVLINVNWRPKDLHLASI